MRGMGAKDKSRGCLIFAVSVAVQKKLDRSVKHLADKVNRTLARECRKRGIKVWRKSGPGCYGHTEEFLLARAHVGDVGFKFHLALSAMSLSGEKGDERKGRRKCRRLSRKDR